jgi:hypothetical protein
MGKSVLKTISNMITPRFNEQELLSEILRDLKHVMKVSDNKNQKVRRIIQKSTIFPVRLHSYLVSPKKNKWLLLWEAHSKKHVDDNVLLTTILIHDTICGKYAYMPIWGGEEMQLIAFPPHFFSRFRQRMNLSDTGVDLIKRYFEENASYGFQFSDEVVDDYAVRHVYGRSKEGVAMGLMSISRKVILFKTFVSVEMLKGEQIENFAEMEKVRREMYEDELIYLNSAKNASNKKDIR